MTVTAISRDWGEGPSTVRMTTTNTYQELVEPGYLASEQTSIEAVNNGPFDWNDNDVVLAVGSNDLTYVLHRNASGNLISAGIAPSILLYNTVAITAAEFNGMYAAPKLLVAAPGANLMHVLERAVLVQTYGSAAFANGGNAAVQYDDTANGAGTLASAAVSAASFQATASTSYMFEGALAAGTFATTVNTGLYLSNLTGAFDTGDSTFVMHMWYRTIETV
jgi:hypothetical protein